MADQASTPLIVYLVLPLRERKMFNAFRYIHLADDDGEPADMIKHNRIDIGRVCARISESASQNKTFAVVITNDGLSGAAAPVRQQTTFAPGRSNLYWLHMGENASRRCRRIAEKIAIAVGSRAPDAPHSWLPATASVAAVSSDIRRAGGAWLGVARDSQ